MSKIGHNGIDAGPLRAFIERIEHLEEEKRAIAEDIKEVYAEAKGTGYDVKIMRKIISLRRMDRDKRREEEEILEIYLAALGEAGAKAKTMPDLANLTRDILKGTVEWLAAPEREGRATGSPGAAASASRGSSSRARAPAARRSTICWTMPIT